MSLLQTKLQLQLQVPGQFYLELQESTLLQLQLQLHLWSEKQANIDNYWKTTQPGQTILYRGIRMASYEATAEELVIMIHSLEYTEYFLVEADAEPRTSLVEL